jgi:hypothetical protein
MSTCRIPTFSRKNGDAHIGKIYIMVDEDGEQKSEVVDLSNGDWYLHLASKTCKTADNTGGFGEQLDKITEQINQFNNS